jgi:hypothetical protein
LLITLFGDRDDGFQQDVVIHARRGNHVVDWQS